MQQDGGHRFWTPLLTPQLTCRCWASLDDLLGRQPLAQKRQGLRPVADVDHGLRGDGADARLGPEHAVADREDARLHSSADLARLGVEAEDRGFGEGLW